MANSLADPSKRITQRTQVRFNRIAQACGMCFVKVVSNPTGRAGIFTSLKQANCWSAHLGLKTVDVSKICVEKNMYELVSKVMSKAMADQEISRKLIWEDE